MRILCDFVEKIILGKIICMTLHYQVHKPIASMNAFYADALAAVFPHRWKLCNHWQFTSEDRTARMHNRYSEIKTEKENEKQETSSNHIFYVINKLKRNHMNEHRRSERKSGGTNEKGKSTKRDREKGTLFKHTDNKNIHNFHPSLIACRCYRCVCCMFRSVCCCCYSQRWKANKIQKWKKNGIFCCCCCFCFVYVHGSKLSMYFAFRGGAKKFVPYTFRSWSRRIIFRLTHPWRVPKCSDAKPSKENLRLSCYVMGGRVVVWMTKGDWCVVRYIQKKSKKFR